MPINYDITNSVTAETLSTGRTYFTPTGQYPSITTLLGKTSPNQIWLQKWKERVGEEEAARVSKEATDRGSLVHEYLEKYWNGIDIVSDLAQESIKIRNPVNALISGTSKNVTEVWAQEIPIWSESLGFAGRVDMIGRWKDIPSIIDFKTSKKTKKVTDIKDYFLQCCGYAHAHNELFGTDIKKIVVIIGIDGETEPQIFEQRASVFLPELKYRIAEYKKLYET